MAFSSTVLDRMVIGDRVKVFGTYTNGTGDVGGNIATGLSQVQSCILQKSGSGTGTITHSVNETFPLAGGDVTIVTGDQEDGFFDAIGYE